jgi:hypothetical protein
MSGLRSLAERTRLRLKTRASKPGTWVRNPTFASSISRFRSFFGWSNNWKKARINNYIFAQQGVLQALRPNSRDATGILARGAEHNRRAPTRSAVVQPVSSFHRFLFRLRGPNDLLKRTPERCAIVNRPDLAGGFTNARGAIDVGQFYFFSGHYLSFKLEGSRLIGGLGHFNGLQKPKSNPIRDSPNFSPFRGQHRPPALALCNSRRPAVMPGSSAAPRSFPTSRARRGKTSPFPSPRKEAGRGEYPIFLIDARH